MENDTISINGKPVTCSHCGGTRFTRHEVKLVPPFIDFGLFWRWARVFECVCCGHIEWFFEVSKPEDPRLDRESECLSCGEVIPPQATACPKCGWTYQ